MWYSLIVLSAARAATVDVYPGDDVITLTASLQAGDEIIFHEGTYSLESSFYWTGEGTEDAPIVLRAASGEKPVLEWSAGPSYYARIENASWLTVEGLTFQGAEGWEEAGAYGVQLVSVQNLRLADSEIAQSTYTLLSISGDSAQLEIVGNHLHDVAVYSALAAGCSDGSCWLQDSRIEGNWIHDVGDGGDYGVWLSPGSFNNSLLDNVIYRISDTGIQVDDTVFGEGNIVEGNVIWDTASAGLRSYGASRIRNNVIFNTGGYGIRAGYNSSFDSLQDQIISYNTVVNTGDYAAKLSDWSGRQGMVFSSNVLANPLGLGLLAEDAMLDPELNYITQNHVSGYTTGLDEFPEALVPGAGFADFEDAESWDFYPIRDSQLVDAGDAAGEAWIPELDFNGIPREGDAPDVGAYEWDGDGNPGWLVREDFKELTSSRGGGEAIEGGGCCKSSEESQEAGLFLLPWLGLGAAWRRRRED